MAIGKRKRERQSHLWVATTEFPTAASHPFYTRLNQLLREHGFDDFAERQCAPFYADTIGRPGLPPGIYFRLLLIGYFDPNRNRRALSESNRALCGTRLWSDRLRRLYSSERRHAFQFRGPCLVNEIRRQRRHRFNRPRRVRHSSHFCENKPRTLSGFWVRRRADRLWQLEYSRRLAYGTLSEIAGPTFPVKNASVAPFGPPPTALMIDTDIRTRNYTAAELDAQAILLYQ